MHSSVIVALDFDSPAKALALVERLGPQAGMVKVGMQLLMAGGPDVVRALVARGKGVFLDLKLHEIPNSVASAVRAAGQLDVAMVTVHASAGSSVLRAAVEAARPFAGLQVVALTVITSLSDEDLPEIGLAPSVDEQVARLALLAAASGCAGVVASAHEARFLRGLLPPAMAIVCPGVQLAGSAGNDQARVATPRAAAAAGATHIVIGRAISAAADPVAAFQAAVAEFDARA
jgi:orotidine-5'-phosphate decarboxylase